MNTFGSYAFASWPFASWPLAGAGSVTPPPDLPVSRPGDGYRARTTIANEAARYTVLPGRTYTVPSMGPTEA